MCLSFSSSNSLSPSLQFFLHSKLLPSSSNLHFGLPARNHLYLPVPLSPFFSLSILLSNIDILLFLDDLVNSLHED